MSGQILYYSRVEEKNMKGRQAHTLISVKFRSGQVRRGEGTGNADYLIECSSPFRGGIQP
jgi:hypothetical protein